jgi:excisionase family DNA binding protein
MKETFKNVPTMKSICECSQITGLAKYHVRQLVLQDKIKYVKAGRKYLVNLESLIEYLNNGETQTNTEIENSNKIRKVGE